MTDNPTEKIKSRLTGQQNILGKDKYLNSAVLIPLFWEKDELHILFEKRAEGIRQGGEVSFPGGEFDKNKDTGYLDTALRETFEEIGVSKEIINVLGKMGTLIAPMGVTVDPFIGLIENIDLKNLNIDKFEVQKIFSVPLSYFMINKPAEYNVRLEVKPSIENKDGTITELLPVKKLKLPEHYSSPWVGRKHRVLVYENTGEIIWGITAEILYELCNLLR